MANTNIVTIRIYSYKRVCDYIFVKCIFINRKSKSNFHLKDIVLKCF